MTYDSLNRLIQIDYLTGHGSAQEIIDDTEHYQYDDFGDLIQIRNI